MLIFDRIDDLYACCQGSRDCEFQRVSGDVHNYGLETSSDFVSVEDVKPKPISYVSKQILVASTWGGC